MKANSELADLTGGGTTRGMDISSDAGRDPSGPRPARAQERLDGVDVGGAHALRALLGLVGDLRALGERPEAIRLDGGVVDEQVLAAVIRRDEPVALVVAEPLDGPGCHATTSTASCALRTRRCMLQSRDAEHFCAEPLRLGLAPLAYKTAVRASLFVLILVTSLAGAVARADVRIDGHGFGHGAGLAQYGALGYARDEGRDFRWILDHYYPGTRLEAVPRARLRVRLKEAVALRVTAAAAARGAGRRLKLRSARTYRFAPWRADQVRVIDLSSRRTLAHLTAPVRLTAGGRPLKLIGRAENKVSDGRYRGALVLTRNAANVVAMDDVDLEQYLYGVVPAEMPATWPAAALQAQAVAARSYALRSRRPTQPFDVFADTRSQAYGGVDGEQATTTAAVRATRALTVMAGAEIAQTLFHSSSGGRTAAVEEVFDSPPLPYLVSVDDPYDRLSPYHDWSVALTERTVAEKLAELVPGDFADLAVIATTVSGRAATVRITGSEGMRDVPASTVRTRLGLRSTWFTITRD